jgi:hypothetical protein
VPPPVLEVNEIAGDADHLAMMNVDVPEVDAPEAAQEDGN